MVSVAVEGPLSAGQVGDEKTNVCEPLLTRKQDWVLDLDVRAFFDSVPHDLLLKAVAHHTDERWVLLYISRWHAAVFELIGDHAVILNDPARFAQVLVAASRSVTGAIAGQAVGGEPA